MHKDRSHPYRAYLLRCWREREAETDQEPLWRFSVEEIPGERRQQGFSSLGALITFLRAELAGGGAELANEEIY
jgi:hypothetical protein